MSGRLPVPDVEKRPRDAATEALIAEALAEEEARKKARKAQDGGEGALVARVCLRWGRVCVRRRRPPPPFTVAAKHSNN